MATFVALDFETANRYRDSACAIGLVRVEDGQIVQRQQYLIRPPSRRFEFTHIHGLSWSDVAHQPDFGELWPKIAQIIQDVDFLAAHNAPFDRSVLYACCEAHNVAFPPQSFTCSMQLARQAWKLKKANLPTVCDYLGLSLNHHDSLSDAEACARIVIAANGYTPNEKSKTIIRCPSCNARLRVTSGQTGTIICPRCEHNFIAST